MLGVHLDSADDKKGRETATDGIADDGSVFALQAWTPRAATADVRAFAKQRGLALTVESARAEDTPPTLLSNPKRIAGAEGLVTFYITPGYHSWDPTPVFFFSLSIFYAMIVSDCGYGLLMFGLYLLLWRRLGESRATARFRSVLLSIVAATIVYGIAVGSYFGVEPAPGSILDALRVRVDGQPLTSNQNLMMAISVAVGVAHLTMANLISAWNSRLTSRWLGHLGWAMIIFGAFLLGVNALWQVVEAKLLGEVLIPVGAICVLLFSSDQPWASLSPKTHLKRLLDGLMQVANVPKAFGDTLSYLRLFALGLASAQLAITFNGLAFQAFAAGGIGVLLGLTILGIGHGINFLLGLMGGVVHGLRLNCIEFLNWSLTIEGYPFQPFKKKAQTS